METLSSSNLLSVDDIYFSILSDETQIFPLSDEKYAEELQFQEALMSSLVSILITTVSSSQKSSPSSSSSSSSSASSSNSVSMEEPKIVEKEDDESSETQILCEICVEMKPNTEMFRNKSCFHTFCTDCTSKYIISKVQENINMVRCPALNCRGVIEPHLCHSFIPKQVFERWDEALCESIFMGSQKFYCPFKDCSAMLIDDGGERVMESECPNCRRLFCAQCETPWHPGVVCEEFQKLNEDERKREDLMVMELAKSKKWIRCSQCKFFVEKREGCLHVTCRCGYHFCYRCGSKWSDTHYGCLEG